MSEDECILSDSESFMLRDGALKPNHYSVPTTCKWAVTLVVMLVGGTLVRKYFFDQAHIEAPIAPTEYLFPVSQAESYGWFNVPNENWEKMKKLHFMTQKHQLDMPETWNHQGKYMNWNWFESFSCPVPPLRLGKGDGGKIVCDPFTLKKPDCLVYSIGSNGDFEFESHILEWNKDCEIHTFDHTWTPDGREKKYTNYHQIGLGAKKEGKIDTLENIVKDLGHVDRRITLLKIDCEGCETTVHPNFYMKGVNIAQLLMEVHFKGDRKPHETMMNNLHNNGFVIFSKEPNTGYSNGWATEFSFLRFDPSVFNRDRIVDESEL